MIPVFSEVYGHSMFNSAEETLGGYRVQVATLPEFPQIGETSQILFRVTDLDLEEVDRFTLGARFFYNGQQVDAMPPKSYQGGHVEICCFFGSFASLSFSLYHVIKSMEDFLLYQKC